MAVLQSYSRIASLNQCQKSGTAFSCSLNPDEKGDVYTHKSQDIFCSGMNTGTTDTGTNATSVYSLMSLSDMMAIGLSLLVWTWHDFFGLFPISLCPGQGWYTLNFPGIPASLQLFFHSSSSNVDKKPSYWLVGKHELWVMLCMYWHNLIGHCKSIVTIRLSLFLWPMVLFLSPIHINKIVMCKIVCGFTVATHSFYHHISSRYHVCSKIIT